MSKAEERAFEAYPQVWDEEQDIDINEGGRFAYIEGYEQAEKDLAPLIETATIVYEAWNGGTMDDVRRGMVELGKQFKEDKKP